MPDPNEQEKDDSDEFQFFPEELDDVNDWEDEDEEEDLDEEDIESYEDEV